MAIPTPDNRCLRILMILGVLIGLGGAAPRASAAEPVRIGVLAIDDLGRMQSQWQPLADALARAIPGHEFVIEILDHDSLELGVASRYLDFVLTNPSHYILIADRHGLSAPLATLVRDLDGAHAAAYGGVIFGRADEVAGIETLADLRGRRIATIGSTSFAGYQIQAYELERAGLQITRDVELVTTGMPYARAVEAVLSGRTELGFVRTGVLERLASEGRLSMSRIAIINPQNLPDYPPALSTRLYPEFPFGALPHIDQDLARRVAAALFMLQDDPETVRAIGIGGFSVPLDYSPVRDLLKTLRLPPFEAPPSFTPLDVWNRFRLSISIGLFALGLILALSLWLFVAQRRLAGYRRELERRVIERTAALEAEIAERRFMEQTVRTLNAELECRVEERTAEARAASAAKSEFLAHMSHEIRTPMNAVLGLAQVLEYDALTPNQRDMVERIRSAGQPLLDILNEILDFSKIEAGRLTIEPHPFELSPVLDKLRGLMSEAARAKGLALKIRPPSAELGPLSGDVLRLEQVLTNLIGNAVKFTERGEVVVEVETLALDETIVRLRFSVRDTGIGIAPEVVSELFSPFTQGERGISRRFGGTGLGLSICKRLVELMGGQIGVESQVGRGSRFWFELSFERVSVAEVLVPVSGVHEFGRRLVGAHLLAVDDSAMNRDLVERILTREGARVTLAADGRQALERLSEHRQDFDAVLMDVRMPVMDGLTATRLIRADLGLKTLPVIALTAGVLAEQREAAHAAGVNDFIPKPLDLEQMLAVLLHWITPRSALTEVGERSMPVDEIRASSLDPSCLTPPEPEVLSRLREALRLNNSKARKHFDEMQSGLVVLLGQAGTEAMGLAIRRLRFGEALAILDEACAPAGVADEVS